VGGPQGVAATIHVVSGPFSGQTLTIQIAEELVELLESDDGQLRIDMLYEGLCRAVDAPDGLLRTTDRGWSIASADPEV
jgi:hypothetical protein